MTDTRPGGDTASRRELIAASLLGAMPPALGPILADTARASPLNPEQTIIRVPDRLAWRPTAGYPERSSDRCALTGDVNGTGNPGTLQGKESTTPWSAGGRAT